jgi:phosphoribosylamine--glycine ligase
MQWITEHVLQPTVQGMAARGTPYVGVLYAGLMLTQRGPQTLEFNCRFGDPETQVILPLLETDLVEVLLACCNGNLSDVAPRISWHDGACASVVLAAPGYPGNYPKGLVIHGLEQATALPNTMVFHAGTALKGDHIVTNGGRVLAVCAVGQDMDEAISAAYAGVERIRFDGMHHRHDIGKRQQ